MKKLLFGIFAAVVMLGTSASAGTAFADSADPEVAPTYPAEVIAPPAGASLFEIVRWLTLKTPNDHHTGPDGSFYDYQREGSLGFISATPFAGSHPLYSCARTYNWNGLDAIDRFTSASPNCEGVMWSVANFLGYVSSSQIPGTIPLYRCLFGKDHFDSIQGCEGYPVEGVLGFVFA